MENLLNVALIQHACPKTNNLSISIAGIKQAAAKGCELVVLPELHCSPYFCVTQDNKNFDLAETIPGPTCEALAKAAREYNVVIVGSVFERRTAGVYHNTAVVFERDGSIAGQYRKMHIPDDPGYNEKFYFTPGDLGFQPIKTSLATLGVLVCWDQWFPEAARLMAMAGAEILIYPTAIGWNQTDDRSIQQQQLDAWITIQRAHAIANGLPLLSCNRVGQETEDGDIFWGNSFICGAQGEILARCGDQAAVINAKIDLTASEKIRRSWPFLRDRRIDAYKGLLKRFSV
ncbi:MAG: carbon-nitrogen hydrolase [Gammaproteobacteria bacterium]|nr:carbon-nitrogen hydrolase [Gammaproteobacteria bacterium]